jgi:NADH-quinone oxidoreductase subunit M
MITDVMNTMMTWPVLSYLTWLPLLGALGIALLPSSNPNFDKTAKTFALITTLVVFILSLTLVYGFNNLQAGFQFVENKAWLPSLKLSYHLGIDGISLWFVLLSTFLMPICILASWSSITKRVKEYLIAFLVLETTMIGTFVALDTFLFYVFFEAVLIPMFLLIGIWGGQRRVYAAFKFFLYTLLGSLLMLIALIAIYLQTGSSDLVTLMQTPLSGGLQFWIWIAFFVSFAVKMPMWPVHTWLPDAHVEAPTAGSVILAGVLLKMGGYGFLRFALPLAPIPSVDFAPYVQTLSVIAIIYTSLTAFAQNDMKKMIAYSSVAHMGYVTLGIFALNKQGLDGAMFQMLSHGIISSALFLCVGVIYDRLHTREISRYGGLVQIMPKYAFVFMVFMLGSVGLPGTGGFVGEFISLLGAFKANTVLGTLAASGIVLGAIYMLSLYRRVVFGQLDKDDVKVMPDLSAREILIFVPLVILVLWMGIAPNSFMKPFSASVDQLLIGVQNQVPSVGR